MRWRAWWPKAGTEGLEPSQCGLTARCSAAELRPQTVVRRHADALLLPVLRCGNSQDHEVRADIIDGHQVDRIRDREVDPEHVRLTAIPPLPLAAMHLRRAGVELEALAFSPPPGRLALDSDERAVLVDDQVVPLVVPEGLQYHLACSQQRGEDHALAAFADGLWAVHAPRLQADRSVVNRLVEVGLVGIEPTTSSA